MLSGLHDGIAYQIGSVIVKLIAVILNATNCRTWVFWSWPKYCEFASWMSYLFKWLLTGVSLQKGRCGNLSHCYFFSLPE